MVIPWKPMGRAYQTRTHSALRYLGIPYFDIYLLFFNK